MQQERTVQPQPKYERDSPLSDVTCDFPDPQNIDSQEVKSHSSNRSIYHNVSLKKGSQDITSKSNGGEVNSKGSTVDELHEFDASSIDEGKAIVQIRDHIDFDSVEMERATAEFSSENTLIVPGLFECESVDRSKPADALEETLSVGTNINSDDDCSVKSPSVNMNLSCELDRFDTPASGNNKPDCKSEGYKVPTTSDDNPEPSNSLSKALATPLNETQPNDATAYSGAVDSKGLSTDFSNVDTKDLDGVTTNSGIKILVAESPMLLDSSRRNAEQSDVESVDISLFHDLEPGEKSPADNRRSYGTYNRPNWSMKRSIVLKSTDPTAGQRQLIGWDDVKCRPIYQVSQPKQCIQPVEAETENTCGANKRAKLQKSSLKKRVYASTFKMSGIFKAARHNMDVESPISLHDSNTRRVTMENEALEESSTFDAPENQLENSVFDFASEKCSDQYNETSEDANKEMKETANQSENRVQPTSKSTLESARAYFRCLDSNHHLTIIIGQDPPARDAKLDVIRTFRKIKHCDQLQDEYDEYCKMTEGTEIDPISIDEFARHWNLYFTERGVIRDGLLDED
jgi:hypothetical protein